MDYKSLALEVVEIAAKAGVRIMEIYNAAEGIVYDKKTDNSPLTRADSEGNTIICEALEQLATQFPIISEENKLLSYEDRKDYDHFWLVDPLDGTKEFIKRNGEFTVNIALIKGQHPVMSVVLTPVTNEMYWAVKGLGAFLIKDGKTTQLNANEFTMEDDGLGVVCSRSHLNQETQDFIDKLSNPTKVSTGSSLKFLILAEGGAHVYPRIAPTMEWDTAAAQMILEAAGGKVISNETGEPLLYNKENLLNPYFVAYGNLK
ncbi:MAG: 3'(2'), 5'-bisphosphate nucleotidase [Saprospiraceae bacterium]|jgi:3'(2'), 5'-bisphosphate nucleotidase|tara:strand:+ start:114 stop:893 length:780 start_codon:yes stop_codon:yes gene_type:complete